MGIRIRGALSDGSFDKDTTITYVFGDLKQGNKPYVDEATGQPLATAVLRVMSKKDIERIHARYTTKIADGTGRMVPDISDPQALKSDLLSALIVSWEGVEAEDGTPLECTTKGRLALDNLDPPRTADMLERAMANEVVGSDAASFR